MSDIDFLNLSRLSFGTDNWALIPSLAIYILPNTSILDHRIKRWSLNKEGLPRLKYL